MYQVRGTIIAFAQELKLLWFAVQFVLNWCLVLYANRSVVYANNDTDGGGDIDVDRV